MLITRRGLTAAALLAGVGSPALAQDDTTTRGLPRTHAGTTLNVLWGPEPVFQAMATYSAAFTDATGIRMDFTQVSYADRYRKMMLDVSSRTNSFDVYLNAYQWKEELAPYVVDHARIPEDVPGAPPLELDDFPPRALEVYSRAGDKTMALPLNGSATFLVWNKKAYREAGLDPDRAPRSWEEVVSNGEKLRADRRYGFNMPAGKSIQTACVWITLFHAFGGAYRDAGGQPAFNSEPGLRATRFMAERLQKISPPGNLTWDSPEMLNAVLTGQAAQGFLWAGAFSTLLDPSRSVVSKDLGWAPTPEAVMLGGWAMSVNANSRGREPAKLWAAWLTSREVSRRLALIAAQPCRISAFRDPEVVAKYPQLPAVLAGMSGKVAAYMPIRDSEQINTFIYDEVNAACAGTRTPEQAVAAMQDKVVTFMRRRGYLRG